MLNFKVAHTLSFSFICLFFVVSCNTTKDAIKSSNIKEMLVFNEAGKDILPIQKRSRKKWDNAIIGNLDQD